MGLSEDFDQLLEKPKPKRYCPSCGRSIPMDANLCPYCGNDFRIKEK